MKNEASNQQLTLLPSSPVGARFQLSKDTRERSMRHVAEIRQHLAERRTADTSSNVITLHSDTNRAA